MTSITAWSIADEGGPPVVGRVLSILAAAVADDRGTQRLLDLVGRAAR